MDEEKLLEIIKGQSAVISALTELIQTLSSQTDQDVEVSGFNAYNSKKFIPDDSGFNLAKNDFVNKFPNMTLQSEKISKVLHEKNLTWGWLMEHSDVSRSTLSQIKNGKNNATFSTMEKIADALDVSLDEFRTKK